MLRLKSPAVTTIAPYVISAWLVSLAAVVSTSAVQPQASTGTRSVWEGVFTDEQAKRGQEQYLRACSVCHSEDLRGQGEASALVGEAFMFAWNDQTLEDLFAKVRTTMPNDAPASLGDQVYADIISYLLQMNKFPAGEKELLLDPKWLQSIIITKKPPGKP